MIRDFLENPKNRMNPETPYSLKSEMIFSGIRVKKLLKTYIFEKWNFPRMRDSSWIFGRTGNGIYWDALRTSMITTIYFDIYTLKKIIVYTYDCMVA